MNPAPGKAALPLAALTELLESLPEVRLAVLFGSHARRQGRSDSDVDMLLQLDPDSEDVRHAVAASATRIVRREVDVVHRAEASPLLRYQVARDGVVLKQREPGDWVRFKAQAMVDWWDWAPTARRIHAAAVGRLRDETPNGRR
jgi:predicted nucleotidyltransferase